MIRYVGIDLGQKGSISVQVKAPMVKPSLEIYSFWDRFGGTRLRTATRDEIKEMLFEAIPDVGLTYVMIESPILMPKNGTKAIAGLFEGYGYMLGLLSALNVTIKTMNPRQWKAVVGAPGSDKTKMVDKATLLFKDTRINCETADSVLISEACRLTFKD